MQKYHIQITVHPVEDGAIDTRKKHMSIMTQGAGAEYQEVIRLAQAVSDYLTVTAFREDVDGLETTKGKSIWYPQAII